MATTKEKSAEESQKVAGKAAAPKPRGKKGGAVATLADRMVMPAVSAQEALEAWQAYQELKGKIIDPANDIQIIRDQEFKKKSYWRKVATFFNLSIETREEWKEMLGRTLVWHFTVRATAPNGRYVDGVGSCDVFEKATLRDGKYMAYNSFKSRWEEAIPNSPHNVRSTAYTRAYNRAVSDLIGGGEVSAEEIQGQQTAIEADQMKVSPGRVGDEHAQPTEESGNAFGPPQPETYQCERCEARMDKAAMLRSKERYDGHVLCFKHQMERYKARQSRSPKQKPPTSA